jgi:hypothetical protein
MTNTKPEVAGTFFGISMAGDGSPAGRRSPAAVMYDRSVFVITFSKIISKT